MYCSLLVLYSLFNFQFFALHATISEECDVLGISEVFGFSNCCILHHYFQFHCKEVGFRGLFNSFIAFISMEISSTSHVHQMASAHYPRPMSHLQSILEPDDDLA